ncbi:MAG: cytochrome c oxidase subunit 4 [Chloroflexi bacterium]|nr:cytochrome c oxidase subunit 4 [Chloroflexota bacterium]MCL5274884.1 cytochrome c oxidase subunit 4 [Chloroflexota bacterium]
MDVNNETVTPVDEEEEPIHLPPPSWAPIILALGLAGIAFGVVLTPLLLIVGVVLFLIGLGIWVSDEIRNASASDEHSGQQASNSAV